ncbi:hypothetical protein FACS1894142_8970 [Spirochaetia bacterium]|nr:hypothetical protein FACS1894142_8970 [Spirochaetia bacterium]
MYVKRILIPGLLMVSLFSPVFVPADDQRVLPMDMYLIIDGSATGFSARSNGRDAAIGWICDDLVDGLLMEGDRLSVWNAGEKAAILFSGSLTGADTKDAAKNAIRSMPIGSGSPDYAGALREITGLTAGNSDRLVYTILVSGPGFSPAVIGGGNEVIALLRYSRMQDFPGWRTIVVDLGIGERVRSAAAAYMR